jgi:hypothetical protein
MSKISVVFEAETPDKLLQLVLNYTLQNKKPPSWLGASLDAEALQAEAEARERLDAEDAAEDEARHAKGNGADPEPKPKPEPEPEPEPTPAPEPAKRARAARAPRVSAVPPPAAPAPAAAAPPPPPPVDLPPLDTLKSVVTAAVRLAQKGEGSKAILDLLPGFKDATGLAFVMNAEDKHRAALYDLVQAAGLPVV